MYYIIKNIFSYKLYTKHGKKKIDFTHLSFTRCIILSIHNFHQNQIFQNTYNIHGLMLLYTYIRFSLTLAIKMLMIIPSK